LQARAAEARKQGVESFCDSWPDRPGDRPLGLGIFVRILVQTQRKVINFGLVLKIVPVIIHAVDLATHPFLQGFFAAFGPEGFLIAVLEWLCVGSKFPAVLVPARIQINSRFGSVKRARWWWGGPCGWA